MLKIANEEEMKRNLKQQNRRCKKIKWPSEHLTNGRSHALTKLARTHARAHTDCGNTEKCKNHT